MTEDEAREDAFALETRAEWLCEFFRVNGRLPYPAGPKVREVHRKLGEIVAKMDEKQKEIAA